MFFSVQIQAKYSFSPKDKTISTDPACFLMHRAASGEKAKINTVLLHCNVCFILLSLIVAILCNFDKQWETGNCWFWVMFQAQLDLYKYINIEFVFPEQTAPPK